MKPSVNDLMVPVPTITIFLSSSQLVGSPELNRRASGLKIEDLQNNVYDGRFVSSLLNGLFNVWKNQGMSPTAFVLLRYSVSQVLG